MTDTELYLTRPFACGTAFAVSVLDSLMSAVSGGHRDVGMGCLQCIKGHGLELEPHWRAEPSKLAIRCC